MRRAARKDGSKAPSKRRLTNPQKYWHSMWRGFVVIVESVDDALAAVGMGVINAK